MKKFLPCLLLATAFIADAQSPLWLRNTAISPDGETIAFTYKGNIWTVPVSGGEARQITQGNSTAADRSVYNTLPFWSPDGRNLVFSSDREGSQDIYVVSSKGGTPKRLTTNSATETPLGFKDNNTVIFTSSMTGSPIAATGPFFPQVYEVDTEGGRPRLMTSIPMRAADIDAKGRILYQDRKSVEDALRKHEMSSGTGDIWLLDNGNYRKLTDFGGNDENPVWGENETYYYTSEKDGTLNVWTASLDGSNRRQLTHFKNHPVRSLSSSDNGTLAFSYDGEIYTLTPGGEPKKINVEIVADEYKGAPAKTVKRNGSGNFSVSPDGESVAFILDGDVYITSVKYPTTRRITDTPAQERTVEFAPDGKSIVYDSERDGQWQIFTTEIKNPDEKSLLYASEIVEKPLYKGEKAAFQPSFSPDGKKVAFLEDRTILKVIDLATKNVTVALDGKYNYSYSDGDVSFQWSPDSRWLLCDYIGIGGWNHQDIALIKADGTEIVDLTESGYSESGADWAMDGKAIVWSTGKYGYKSQGSWGNYEDIMIMFLDGEAYERFNMTKEEAELEEQAEKDKKEDKSDDKASSKDKKKKDKKGGEKSSDEEKDKQVKPLLFDLDNRHFRKVRITPGSLALGGYYLSPKGDNLYFIASTPEKRTLYQRDLKSGDTKTLVGDLSAWGMEADKKGENIYVSTNSGIKKVQLSDGKIDNVEFEAEVTSRPSERRQYIYDHMWNQVNDKFHDVNLHGTDWELYREAYQRQLPYISNNYDFAILLSEILGELNASHTGGRYYAPGRGQQSTSNLGAFFDPSYEGDGLKIVEIVKRGPLDIGKNEISAGDIILSINDSVIYSGEDYYPLLDGKIGKKTKLSVKKTDGKVVTVNIRPIDDGSLRQLLYKRWVERNEHIVDSVSGGKVAYVHIQGMNGPSYSEVYDRLLGKYRNHEAVVVDTRHNGGGWLHNDVALLLNGKEYVRYTPRGRYIGSDPFSQWTKPSVMLVDESNYSDAHGTPYVYKTLGIGDVVGAPVPGTMTAVWWETQIDPSLIFGIPQVTSLDRNGKPLENQQLNPDLVIYNTPELLLQGIDEQLIGATLRVMEKIKGN